ncbi:unnamed protein product [Orchesella dallaii]|uniref:BTB domain-containing protein n=1 Tax=Orchesella dallaii TaxID=48710 RepID=A0ABP1RZJ4_9HEXA
MNISLVSVSNQRAETLGNDGTTVTEGLKMVLTKSITFQSQQTTQGTDTQRIQAYCHKLKGILEKKDESTRSLSLYIDWAPSHPNKVWLRLQGQLLETLQQLCGQDVKLNVDGTLNYYRRDYGGHYSTTFSTADMEIFSPALECDMGELDGTDKEVVERVNDLTEMKEPVCEDTDIKLSDSNFKSYPSYVDNIRATVNIRLRIEDEYIPGHGSDSDKLALICKSILAQNIQSDISIVAADGSILSANKCFLAAHSPVLKASLENNFAESKNSKIEMPDVSKECVESLIGYFYTMDIPEAEKCSSLAVELYQISHKYEVTALEKKISVMLLLRSNSWYGVEAAVELLQFVKRVETSSGADMTKMKAKVLQVLKSKWQRLKTSENFKKLFDEDRDTAMELCMMALEK